LANRTNYLDLDPTYRDSLGDPLLRMTLDWNDNERNMIALLTAKMAPVGRAEQVRGYSPDVLRVVALKRRSNTDALAGEILQS
jgi:hypothetical protein